MKKKLAIIISLVMTFSLLTSNLSFNNPVDASLDVKKYASNIVLYDDDDIKNALEYIKTTKGDDSFKEIKEFSNKNLLKVNFKKAKDINKETDKVVAYPVEVVENDSVLQDNLRSMLKDGKKIYLYGDSITPLQYEQILGIEGVLSVDDSDISTLKENSISNPTTGVSQTKSYNVIGYSLNNEESPYFSEIQLENKNKKNQKFMFIRSILDDQVKSIKKSVSDKSVSFLGVKIPFLKRDSVLANSINVKSIVNTNTYCYDPSNVTMGLINTDWYLFRDYDESDIYYDRFTVETNYELIGYNSYKANYMDVNHKMTSGIDSINTWRPGDGSISESIYIAIPWGLTYQFDPAGTISVDERGSQADDYGRWIVKPPWYNTTFPSPVRFMPSTAWLSQGTYSAIDTSIFVTFYKSGTSYGGVQNIPIRYDY